MDLTDPRTLVLIGGAALLLVVAIAFAIVMTARHRKSRREYDMFRAARVAELTALLDRIMAGELDAYEEIKAYNADTEFPWSRLAESDPELSRRYWAAMEQGKLLTNMSELLPELHARLDDYRAATEAAQQLDRLMQFFATLRDVMPQNIGSMYTALSTTQAAMMAALNLTIKQRHDELLRTATSKTGDGGAQAFLVLRTLIDDTRWRSRRQRQGPFAGIEVAPLERPEGWNELVVRYVQSPSLELFVHEDMPLGGVLHLAAEAERTEDLVQMLLALAFHFDAGPCDTEITEELVTSLIRKVTEVRNSAAPQV